MGRCCMPLALAEEINVRFLNVVLQHTAQIHGAFDRFIEEQTRQKLICNDVGYVFY